ncbi:hypothetical protein GCM10027284_28920 [Cyclobacterium sediminis]
MAQWPKLSVKKEISADSKKDPRPKSQALGHVTVAGLDLGEFFYPYQKIIGGVLTGGGRGI